ncbi:phosphatase PAP2 family protein [Sporichthya sp.]|uniref:phosphatase PAP2 family protein n=1 Tax=Sporichthya sp. TaxID=65475 RepID=UPI001832ACC6|nr:phosphatase PAP2 family protein [Sporichthya sp.]MBA3742514.1 phosphatase PAP2 family protein [Sporichthya sp.]
MRTAHRVAACTALAFGVIALLVATTWSPLMDLDSDVVRRGTNLARNHDTYRHVMKAATWWLNSPLVMAYGGLIAMGLALARRSAAAIWLALVVGIGSLVNPVLKQLFQRDRPNVLDPVAVFHNPSFPSGHANSAALICAAGVIVFWPHLGGVGRVATTVLVVAVPVLVCWTRITLGAHYLSDVVGGTLLGVTLAAACQPALPALERRLSARAARPR